MPKLEGGPPIDNVPEGLVDTVRWMTEERLKGMSAEDRNIILKMAARESFDQMPDIIERAKQKREEAKRGSGVKNYSVDTKTGFVETPNSEEK